MIRHSIHTGLGRGRPELSRLGDGISASLRQFSAAQARCADDDGSRRPPSSRQRSAAAASEMLSMNKQSRPDDRSTAAPNSAPAPRNPTTVNVGSAGGARTGFTGFRRVLSDDLVKPSPGAAPAPGNRVVTGGIIRGGFRGRGGGSFTGRGGGSFAGRGGGNFTPRGGGGGGDFTPRGGGGGGGGFGARGGGSREGGRGRGRGRARRGGADDRPQRSNRPSAEEKTEENEYQRFKAFGKAEDPELNSYILDVETGVERAWQPAAPKDLLASLAGFAPAVPSNASPLAKEATIIRQAVVLGGGRPYHPEDFPSPPEAWRLYKQGHGAFFPNERAKAWVNSQSKVQYQNPPKETQTAVLDAALLGKYDGPKHTDLTDKSSPVSSRTINTVRSFVKRDGTWNAEAERSIEAKIKTLLPAAAPAVPAKARAQAK